MNWFETPRRVFVSASQVTTLLLLCCTTVSAAEPQRLTRDGKLKRDPQYVAGGKQIVYVEQSNPTLMQIVRWDPKTKKATPLHKASKSEFEPSVSRDGRYVAFVQSRGNLSLALVIRDREQKKDAQVKPAGGFCGFRSPCISPDSRRVVYSFADGGRQQLYAVDATNAGNRKKLTDSSGVNTHPDWSPDGKQIVFSSTRNGNYEIYVMNADGGNVRRLTRSRFQDMRPRFSPDGKRIAFVSTRDGNYELYVMNADGSNVTRMTRNEERDDYPAWHPDGKRLVYIGENAGRFDLWSIAVR